MAEFPTFKGLWPWPWIGSYCIPSCITRRRLPTYQISLKSKKLLVDGRTYGLLRPTLLGQLGVDNLKTTWEWDFAHLLGCPHWATGLNFRMLGHTAGENSRAKFCHNRFRDFGVLLPAIFPFFIAESEISPICWDAPLGRSAWIFACWVTLPAKIVKPNFVTIGSGVLEFCYPQFFHSS